LCGEELWAELDSDTVATLQTIGGDPVQVEVLYADEQTQVVEVLTA
jgi:hypothetical protein